MLPPELMRLILAMPPAPSEILEKLRDEDNVHDMAHALIDILGLEESCDDVAARIAAYDDQAFTILLFHMGFIRPMVHILGEDEEDIEDEEIPPERLLN